VPCAAATTGALAPGFLHQSVRYGPSVFYRANVDRGQRSDYKPVAGRYPPARTLILVSKGNHSAVVEVPIHRRKIMSLIFDKARLYPGRNEPVSYGAPAVVFQRCKGSGSSRWIQYPGAVIVAGARCTRLLVIPLKPGTHQPLGKRSHVKIAYGRRSCHA
jgi:hypothetical protein